MNKLKFTFTLTLICLLVYSGTPIPSATRQSPERLPDTDSLIIWLRHRNMTILNTIEDISKNYDTPNLEPNKVPDNSPGDHHYGNNIIEEFLQPGKTSN